ncbi:uncharacterized protein [Manis javanica]|uniref:uncharacterized protein n=1 Tax=Manis javanica TaxID=9974 RepID=UPI003C6D64C2
MGQGTDSREEDVRIPEATEATAQCESQVTPAPDPGVGQTEPAARASWRSTAAPPAEARVPGLPPPPGGQRAYPSSGTSCTLVRLAKKAGTPPLTHSPAAPAEAQPPFLHETPQNGVTRENAAHTSQGAQGPSAARPGAPAGRAPCRGGSVLSPKPAPPAARVTPPPPAPDPEPHLPSGARGRPAPHSRRHSGRNAWLRPRQRQGLDPAHGRHGLGPRSREAGREGRGQSLTGSPGGAGRGQWPGRRCEPREMLGTCACGRGASTALSGDLYGPRAPPATHGRPYRRHPRPAALRGARRVVGLDLHARRLKPPTGGPVLQSCAGPRVHDQHTEPMLRCCSSDPTLQSRASVQGSGPVPASTPSPAPAAP